jgi:hypothetical protein
MAATRHPAPALALHLLRIKGVAEVEDLGVPTGLDGAGLEPIFAELAASGLVERRSGALAGWRPTALGAKLDHAWLGAELEAAGARAAVEEAYREFLALNPALLAACTAWQLKGTTAGAGATLVANDHTDRVYDGEVVARLADIHCRARPVVAALARVLTRFDHYRHRLQGAFERVQAGEGDWFTRPLIDSYHQVWFELHQDLLFTLGLSRTSEDVGGNLG